MIFFLSVEVHAIYWYVFLFCTNMRFVVGLLAIKHEVKFIFLILWPIVSFVLQDIDSDKPMMQVGPYVFVGEYEGKQIKYLKNEVTLHISVSV